MNASRITCAFLVSVLLLFWASIAKAQSPGVECGCDKTGEWISPASKAIKTETGLSVTEGSSPGGTYTLTATSAQYPNVSHLEIKCGFKTILSISSCATAWGFSPDGNSFVMHGLTTGNQHKLWLYNLDPNPSVSGEEAELVQDTPPTTLSTASIRYSPHGKYLLYAGLGNDGSLMLYVYSTKDGTEAYSEVGGAPIAGSVSGKSVAGWGFSPDVNDRTFVHAFLTDATTYGLIAYNLEAKKNVISSLGNTGVAQFKFSKCGDYFLWTTKIGTNDQQCRFYKTSQENASPTHLFSGYLLESLETNATSHVLRFVYDNTEYSFDNTANTPCADDVPPTWPTGASLIAANQTGTSLDLSWDDASEDAPLFYRIYQDGSKITELEDYTSFEVTKLDTAASYNFRVEAGDKSNNWTTNGPSVATATKSDHTPNWDGASLIASEITGTTMKLTWSGAIDDFGVVNYIIYKNGSPIDKVDGDKLNYTVQGLEPQDVDTFNIEAGDAAGNLTNNGPNLIAETVADNPPYWNDGEGIYADENTETTIAFHWDMASDDFGLKEYILYRDNFEIARLKPYITSFTDKDLEAGTSYNYKIEALDKAENDKPGITADLSTVPDFVELPLVIASGAQWRPDVDDRLVVWEDKRNANLDIYEFNLKTDTEAELMVGPDAATQARSSGGIVVWADYRNGSSDIFMTDKYDPEQKIELVCGAEGDQLTPSIDGNIIVWTDERNGNWDIYMYDLSTDTEKAICTNSHSQINPDVSGHMIVWEDARNGNPDIYSYNLAIDKEVAVCTQGDEQRNPVIQTEPNYRVLWQDNRNGDWDIYMQVYFISSFEIMKVYLSYTGNQTHPDISDDVLVYQDDKNGDQDIYAYYFTSLSVGVEKPICDETDDQILPRTSGGRIVWEDHRNDEGDIYIWDRPPGTDLSLDIIENKDPVGVGKTLTYTLTAHNLGPDDEDSAMVMCTLPIEAFLASSSASSGTINHSGLNLKWDIASLPADSTETLELNLETYDLATLKLVVSISGKGFDPDPSNNVVTEFTQVKRVVGEILDKGVSPALFVEKNGNVNLLYGTDQFVVLASKIMNGSFDKRYLEEIQGYQNGDLFQGQDGSIQTCYSDYIYDRSPKSMLYHLQFQNESSWNNNIIALSDSGFSSINMEINRQDDIHLLYQQAPGVAYQAPFKHMKFSNESWSYPEPIYQNGYDHIDMIMDPNGFAHAVYLNINQGAIYQKSLDIDLNTWSSPELIEIDWQGAQLEGMVVDIDLDTIGEPHVIYPGGKGKYLENIMYAYKDNDEWEKQMIDIGFNGSGSNAIALDDSGKVHVCYYHLKSNQLRYATNKAGPWIKQTIEEDAWGSDLDIAMDEWQNVHIAYINDSNVKYAMRTPIQYFTINPDSLNFGLINVGEQKKIQLKLRNPFANKITIDSVRITDSEGFNIDFMPFTIYKGQTDSIAVCFNPSVPMNTSTQMRIYFTSNSKLFMDLPVKASTPIPNMVITPDPISFGYVTPNTSVVKSVTIENKGSDELIISDINVKNESYGSLIPSDFSLASNNCTTLLPGESCGLEIEFYPTSLGIQYSYLNITSNDPDNPKRQVIITGNAQNPTALISISPAQVDFGYAEIGTTKTETVTITSYGELDLEITNETISGTNSDQFSYSNTCTTLAKGESCDFDVSYTPTQTGTQNATLNVYSNSLTNNPFPLSLMGNSIKRELTPAVASIDFGSVMVGSDSTVSVIFTNTGLTDIMVSDIELLGSSYLEFNHKGWSGMLSAGQSFTDTVSFSPIMPGEKIAYLQVLSNDSEFPVMQLPMTAIANVSEPSAIIASAALTTPITCNGGTGEVTITATGGTPPLSYSFDGVSNTTGVFPGISAGTGLSWSVTDASSNGPVSGTLDVTEPAIISANAAVTAAISCNGGAGEVTITASGGTAPLSYTFDGVTNTTGEYSDVSAGTALSWSVKDANSCGPVSGTLDVTEPAIISANAAVTAAISCNGGAGEVTITASGGTAPLSYTFDGVTNTTGEYSDVSAGTALSWSVTDANSCGPVSGTLDVTEPAIISANAAVTAAISCNGGAGEVTITASGGTAPLSYTFDGVTNTTGEYSDVSAGTALSWSVTDANSCGPVSGTLDVTEPAIISANAAVTTAISCNGGAGEVTITASGGTAPLSYTFDGVTNTTGVFSGVSAGTALSWSVTDVNSCGPVSGTIDVTEPAIISANAAVTAAISCNGGAGEVTITASGGTAPLSYTFDGVTNTTGVFSGVSAGTALSWSVTDVNNCGPVSGTLDVTEPAIISANAAVTTAISCNGGAGEVTITASGGTAPLSYTFDGVTNTTGVFSGVSAGTALSWSVTDVNNCGPVSGTLDISEPAYSISGSVLLEDGSAGYTAGKVELYALSELTASNEYDLSGTGVYTFTDLAEGSYTLKFIPDAVANPNALPTYLGNVLLMNDASFVLLDQDLTDQNLNVITVPQEGGGSGNINGILLKGDRKKSTSIMLGKQSGNASALESIYVYLRESGSQLLAGADLTDQDGYFEFNKLVGSSYIFEADYMGIPMDQDNPLLVLEDMEDSISIIAMAGLAEISFEIDITGISDQKLPEGIYIYPNPVRDHLMIRIDKTVFHEGISRIFLIGIQGVIEEADWDEQKGSFQLEMEIDHLIPGVYILRLEGEVGVYNARVVIL